MLLRAGPVAANRIAPRIVIVESMRLVAAAGIALLVLASAAGARTISGTQGRDVLLGTSRADQDRRQERGRSHLRARRGGRARRRPWRRPPRRRARRGSDRRRVRRREGHGSLRRGRRRRHADPLDRVAADCELVSRRISSDPYGNPESQHETEVEPDSLTVGSTTVAAFQVGRRFDGGAANIGFARSVDGGRTWRSGFLPSLANASSPPGPNVLVSDTVVAHDGVHGTWLIAVLAIDGDITRLTVSRSADGLSWSAPVVAAEAQAGTGSGDEGRGRGHRLRQGLDHV